MKKKKVITIRNFNLLVSTSRFNETNAKAELWYSLLICGDKYPIISNLEFSGMISAITVLDSKEFIQNIKKILDQDPNFFQYILKIIHIDHICETKTQIIAKYIEEHYREHISENDTFKIELKRRKNKLIDRNDFIKIVAENLNNKVVLNNPDVIIRFEILGNICGISFLRSTNILEIINQYNQD